MNWTRVIEFISKLVFDGKSFRDLLLIKPLSSVTIEPWWMVQVGYITEEDVGSLTRPQQTVIDQIIDPAVQLAYSAVRCTACTCWASSTWGW